ncbi:MAG: mercuric reductase, partial [FCB group bacterium]|nr:mercuric reductase [FCB group bacterium]
MKQYDAIIIGSGQAGTPLAFTLAAQGNNVAFIEKEHLGGTCLNTGCTPTKAYVASARRMYEALHGDQLGISIPSGAYADIKKIKARKDALIKKSSDAILKAVNNEKNIDLYRGIATFTDFKCVSVEGELLRADKIFINVGARANIPVGFRDADYLTNADILQLNTVPEHLIIIGGSYIGLEFGQMFRRFGSRVTIIERGNRLISREDEAVSEAVRSILEEEGIEFIMNADCISAKREKTGAVTVMADCHQEPMRVTGTHLLLAVGRVPNSDTLNLNATGISVDKKGYIPVNEYLETKIPGIYALGDCNGRGAFTHTSYNDYEIIAGNLSSGMTKSVSDRIPMYALYIDPPLGRAGLTLAQARQTGKKIKYAFRSMKDVARAREKGETKGFMSVVVDDETKKILGASVLGVGGDEVISGIVNIMTADLPYTVIRDS